MKSNFFFASLMVIVFMSAAFFSSCKKSNSVNNTSAGISALGGSWTCPNWVNAGDTLEITFNTNAMNATDTYMNPELFGYKTGDILMSSIITTSTPGTYSCTAEVRSGNNNSVLSMGTIRLILQNNTLTAKYSDINGYADLVFTKQ